MKLALNIGSSSRLFPSTPEIRWINIDQDSDFFIPEDVSFLPINIKYGLPFEMESVDMAYLSHVVDHLNFLEAMSLFKDLHRVLKHDGVMWIAVEDLDALISSYLSGEMDVFDKQQPEIYSRVKSQALKLGMIMFGALADTKEYRGHKQLYNTEGMIELLEMSGFKAQATGPTFMGIPEAPAGKGHSIYIEARK